MQLPNISIPINPIHWVIRREDLLVLGFQFHNLKIMPGPPGSLQRTVATDPAFIVVYFQPQNIAEEAFYEDTTDEQLKFESKRGETQAPPEIALANPPIPNRISRMSRVAFRVPQTVTQIPYELGALLDACSAYAMQVTSTALPPVNSSSLSAQAPLTQAGSPQFAARAVAAQAGQAAMAIARGGESESTVALALNPATEALAQGTETVIGPNPSLPVLHEPAQTETALELPYRLVISPNIHGTWVHSPEPVESPETHRTELWHTRLGVRKEGKVTEENDSRRSVRAIWCRDAVFDPAEPFKDIPLVQTPFRSTLDQVDRHQIVHLSANYHIDVKGERIPVGSGTSRNRSMLIT